MLCHQLRHHTKARNFLDTQKIIVLLRCGQTSFDESQQDTPRECYDVRKFSVPTLFSTSSVWSPGSPRCMQSEPRIWSSSLQHLSLGAHSKNQLTDTTPVTSLKYTLNTSYTFHIWHHFHSLKSVSYNRIHRINMKCKHSNPLQKYSNIGLSLRWSLNIWVVRRKKFISWDYNIIPRLSI